MESEAEYGAYGQECHHEQCAYRQEAFRQVPCQHEQGEEGQESLSRAPGQHWRGDEGQEARAIRTVKCCQHQSLACLAKLAPHGLDVIVILREQAAEVPEYFDFLRAVDVHLIFY